VKLFWLLPFATKRAQQRWASFANSANPLDVACCLLYEKAVWQFEQ